MKLVSRNIDIFLYSSPLADLRCVRYAHPHFRSKFFTLMQFQGKMTKIKTLLTPLRIDTPLRSENPGSATAWQCPNLFNSPVMQIKELVY